MNGRDNRGGRGREQATPLDVSGINLSEPPLELFADIAKGIAATLSNTATRDANKSTQLRRFYDEVVMWEDKVALHPDSYRQSLPQIKMLAAKAAYAQGRNLVDRNFNSFVQHCVKQLDPDKPATLKHFRLLFEAVIGFRKGMEGR